MGRPAAAVLDQDGITAAALQLIGKSGYDGFTMAALARTLNVAPSALYNHVSSKRDVLVLVQDHLTSFVDVTAFEAGPWEQAVRDWAWSYRDVFSKHTPLIPVIAVLPVADAPKTLAMYEAVSAGFSRAGFPQERIIPAIVAFESFIFGSAYDATAPADIFDSGSMAARPRISPPPSGARPRTARKAGRRRLPPGARGTPRRTRGTADGLAGGAVAWNHRLLRNCLFLALRKGGYEAIDERLAATGVKQKNPGPRPGFFRLRARGGI